MSKNVQVKKVYEVASIVYAIFEKFLHELKIVHTEEKADTVILEISDILVPYTEELIRIRTDELKEKIKILTIAGIDEMQKLAKARDKDVNELVDCNCELNKNIQSLKIIIKKLRARLPSQANVKDAKIKKDVMSNEAEIHLTVSNKVCTEIEKLLGTYCNIVEEDERNETDEQKETKKADI